MKYIEENQLLRQDNKMKCLMCNGKGIVEFRQNPVKCLRCNGIGIMICNL